MVWASTDGSMWKRHMYLFENIFYYISINVSKTKVSITIQFHYQIAKLTVMAVSKTVGIMFL
jgi:hypothetical protein